jgi:hypothetical protein
MHGGCSTGPKTAEGRARIAESNRRRAAERRRLQGEANHARIMAAVAAGAPVVHVADPAGALAHARDGRKQYLSGDEDPHTPCNRPVTPAHPEAP